MRWTTGVHAIHMVLVSTCLFHLCRLEHVRIRCQPVPRLDAQPVSRLRWPPQWMACAGYNAVQPFTVPSAELKAEQHCQQLVAAALAPYYPQAQVTRVEARTHTIELEQQPLESLASHDQAWRL